MVRLMSPRRLAVVTVAVAVALAGYAMGRYAPVPEGIADQTAGELMPAVSLVRLGGEAESLERYAGKTLVINVWATWCAPCRRELPSLQQLSARLDPQRFSVIGISIDTDGDFVREYLADVGIRFPNYIDAAQTVTKKLLDLPAVPNTIIVGPDGKIHRRIIGERRWDSPAIVEELQRVAAAGAH